MNPCPKRRTTLLIYIIWKNTETCSRIYLWKQRKVQMSCEEIHLSFWQAAFESSLLFWILSPPEGVPCLGSTAGATIIKKSDHGAIIYSRSTIKKLHRSEGTACTFDSASARTAGYKLTGMKIRQANGRGKYKLNKYKKKLNWDMWT
jgi:hypothetical protein